MYSDEALEKFVAAEFVIGAPETVTVGGVDFVSSVFDVNLNNMQATIPASAALPGTQLFGRLNAASGP